MLEGLVRTKHSSLFRPLESKREKFYEIGHWSQYLNVNWLFIDILLLRPFLLFEYSSGATFTILHFYHNLRMLPIN